MNAARVDAITVLLECAAIERDLCSLEQRGCSPPDAREIRERLYRVQLREIANLMSALLGLDDSVLDGHTVH